VRRVLLKKLKMSIDHNKSGSSRLPFRSIVSVLNDESKGNYVDETYYEFIEFRTDGHMEAATVLQVFKPEAATNTNKNVRNFQFFKIHQH